MSFLGRFIFSGGPLFGFQFFRQWVGKYPKEHEIQPRLESFQPLDGNVATEVKGRTRRWDRGPGGIAGSRDCAHAFCVF